MCHLIHACCLAQLDLDQTELTLFFQVLKETFKHPNQEIQENAAKALKSMCDAFFNQEGVLRSD
jgi:hypothetical protein